MLAEQARAGYSPIRKRRWRRLVGSAMIIIQDASQHGGSRVALPWYEEKDFALLCAMSHEAGEMLPTYVSWRRQADAIRRRMLDSGRAVDIVTVRPGPFLAWLDGAPNTAAARCSYVQELARVRSLN